MANHHLKLEPHHVRDDANTWWYEEAYGISVITENRTQNGTYIGTKTIKISWTELRAALKRKDKKCKK